MSVLSETLLKKSILRAWRGNRGSRLLVYALSTMGVVDAVITWISIERFGAKGELNPVIPYVYAIGLFPFWSVISVFSSFLGGILLVSISIVFDGKVRNFAANCLALVFAIRIFAMSISIGNCFNATFVVWSGMLTGALTAILVRRCLLCRSAIDPDAVIWVVKDCSYAVAEFGNRLLQSVLPEAYLNHDVYSTSVDTTDHELRRPDWKRVFTQIAIIVLTVITLAGLLEFLQGHVFRSVPWWLRELGIVDQIQGQAFLVVFISILLSLAILTYCLLSMAEALGGSQN